MTDIAPQTDRGGKRVRRLFLRLLLSLAATLVALGVAEIVLRVVGYPQFLEPHSDPPRFAFINADSAIGPVYLNMPGRITFRYDGNPRGYFDEQNEVHHDVNPSGFRGPAFRPKAPGTGHLIFLGDSFTFGEGVHNNDTYPQVAARLLRKDEQRVEVFNLGVGGYNTSQEAQVLKLFGLDLQPDVVVVGYTLNDAEPPLYQVDPASGKPVRRPREAIIESEAAPRRPPDSFLYRLRLAQAFWLASQQSHLTKQTVDYYLSLHDQASAGRIESERALREIITECNKRGVPCIVVVFPVLYSLSKDYPFTVIHEQIGQVVRQADGHVIDLLPALMDQNASALIVHPTDQHPNEKVHALAGQLVAQEILRISKSSPKR